MRNYKYRLYPNKIQEKELTGFMEALRQSWNKCLGEYYKLNPILLTEKIINETLKRYEKTVKEPEKLKKLQGEFFSVLDLNYKLRKTGAVYKRSSMQVAKFIHMLWRKSETGKVNREDIVKYKHFDKNKKVRSSNYLWMADTMKNAFAKYYSKMLDKRTGPPRFKKFDEFPSLSFSQSSEIEKVTTALVGKNGWIELPMARENKNDIGFIKLKYHRPLPGGTVKKMTIMKDGKEWFVVFCVDTKLEPFQIPIENIERENTVGIDFGLNYFYYSSDGEAVKPPKFFRHSADRLKKVQQISNPIREKFIQGSSLLKEYFKNLSAVTGISFLPIQHKAENIIREKYTKFLKKIVRIHRHIRNQREYFLYNEAKKLVDKYDVIFVEDLKVSDMARVAKPKEDPEKEGHYIRNNKKQKAGLNKSINDIGWAKFGTILEYKAAEQGKRLIKVDKNGTSQYCPKCSERVSKILGQEEHNCPYCGYKTHRDHAAAEMIKERGFFDLGFKTSVKFENIIKDMKLSASNSVKSIEV